MKSLVQTIVIFNLLLFSSYAYSITQYCGGTITNYYLDAAGFIYVYGTWRNDYTAVCNVNSSWQSISTEVCKGWQAIIEEAHVTRKSVLLRYLDAPACDALPTYTGAPQLDYILVNQ